MEHARQRSHINCLQRSAQAPSLKRDRSAACEVWSGQNKQLLRSASSEQSVGGLLV